MPYKKNTCERWTCNKLPRSETERAFRESPRYRADKSSLGPPPHSRQAEPLDSRHALRKGYKISCQGHVQANCCL